MKHRNFTVIYLFIPIIIHNLKNYYTSVLTIGMEEIINHIRKRPGMYIGTLGNGSHESDGIYNLLKIVFYSLVRQFRSGITDEIAITIQDDRSVTICYPSTDIEYIEIIEALSSSYEIVAENRFTRLSFTPDETIFEGFSFREHIVSDILKSYCYATKGLAIRYNDTTVYAPNGLADLINDELGNNILYPIIHLRFRDRNIFHKQDKSKRNDISLLCQRRKDRRRHSRQCLERCSQSHFCSSLAKNTSEFRIFAHESSVSSFN